MRENETNVGRADHNFDGERSTADDHPIDKPARAKDLSTKPSHAEDNERGTASWGSEGSGGSVKDTRADRER